MRPRFQPISFPAIHIMIHYIITTLVLLGLANGGLAADSPTGDPAKGKGGKRNAAPNPNDPFAKQGNIAPAAVRPTAEKEAAILGDVKVAEGFEVKLFAAPPMVNYPVFIAAAPDGTLYVSSDGNGSLGRDPGRGRIIRLRDTDGDGRADETKVFCEVDAPRGLVWDHDRLYVVHPPDISVYIDKDGDGVADESKILVKGIAFGYDQRPADHTTNGLALGIDGWLYIAGGDFGFMDAVGTDGRHLQHRGGGVIRVRPDGTGLELVSHGTRNILEVAVGPLMEMFARDNTNDGGGWDVRFHHFTGLENHGYPVFHKNFADEGIVPLNDYGGGSGCGAVFLDEPGFGKWNNAPLTADWGTGSLWRHAVERKGSTYVETGMPESFIKMTRPTDGDVDALGHVFAASWKGATFKWEGAEVGYVVRVTPKDFKAPTLPDFARAGDEALVKLLESPSHRTRLAAQRALMRRDGNPATAKLLLALAADKARPLPSRVAALFGVSQANVSKADGASVSAIAALASDPSIQAYVLLALGDSGLGVNLQPKSLVSEDLIRAGLKSGNAQTRLNALIAATRQRMTSLAAEIANLLGDEDAVIDHTAQRALAMLDAAAPCLVIVDNTAAPVKQRDAALRSLRMMHKPEVVTGLIDRIGQADQPAVRQGVLAALCRLHFQEGEWKGDSWGTRPDTRGPYYQPEPWSETPRVFAALSTAMDKSTPEDTAFLVREMTRNRIQSTGGLERILSLAKQNPKVIPDAVAQLATAGDIPASAVPVLVQAAGSAESSPETIALAIAALAKTDSADGVRSSLGGLVKIEENIAARSAELAVAQDNPDPVVAKKLGKDLNTVLGDARKKLGAASAAFVAAAKLENHHQLLEKTAAEMKPGISQWADAALLHLSGRKTGSPESRLETGKALDTGWQSGPQRRVQILQAANAIQHRAWSDRILAAFDDPDKSVKQAAAATAKSLKLTKVEDTTPKLGTLAPDALLAAVLKAKGDAVTGEQVFAKATCTACHTTSQDQPQRGPYLGNIAQTYKRPDLAQAILDPNKTIAQGFATNVITMKDGAVQMGFVTNESGDKVTIRNIAAQEFTFAKADIAKRDTLPTSIMPPGLMMNSTVREFASLLDYLESLAKAK